MNIRFWRCKRLQLYWEKYFHDKSRQIYQQNSISKVHNFLPFHRWRRGNRGHRHTSSVWWYNIRFRKQNRFFDRICFPDTKRLKKKSSKHRTFHENKKKTKSFPRFSFKSSKWYLLYLSVSTRKKNFWA